MAGHSQFKNIMHRKGAQDAKRAKIFARHSREIMVAVREGNSPDPSMNPRLRGALQAARGDNMPKDNIERAIKKASDTGEGDNYEEMRYEGFGPGGVGIIVEALTDNRNRTASEVRSTFSKNGGTMGETGSVSYQFDRVGLVELKAEVGDPDTVFEAAVEAGADDVVSSEELHEIYCDVASLQDVSKALEDQFGEPKATKLTWKPQATVEVDADKAATLMKLLEALDDNDDVQQVTGNYEIPDEVLAQLG